MMENQTKYSGKIGLYSQFIGVFVLSNCALLPLNVFEFGIWRDTELSIIAMFLGAGFCYVGLFLLSRSHPSLISKAITHPIFLLFMLMVIWSAAGGLVHGVFLNSLLGTAETGHGVLWYLSLAGALASCQIIKNMKPLRWILFYNVSVLVVIVIVNLNVNPHIPLPLFIQKILYGFSFHSYNDYLAYFVPSILVACGVYFRGHRYPISIGLLFLALVLLAVSQNLTAAISIPACVVFVLVCYILFIRCNFFRDSSLQDVLLRSVMSVVAGAIPLLIVIAVYFQLVAPDLESLFSRNLLYKIIIEDFINQPEALFTGFGWGMFNEAFQRNIGSLGVNLAAMEWADLDKNQFHSHNSYLTSLHSAGLPGLMLTIALTISPILCAQRKWLLLAGFSGISFAILDGFWFRTSDSIFLYVLQISLLSRRSFAHKLRFNQHISYLITVTAAVILLYFSLQLAQFSNRMNKVNECMLIGEHSTGRNCPVAIPSDPRGTGVSLSQFLGRYIYLYSQSNNEEISPNNVKQLSLFVDEYGQRSLRNAYRLNWYISISDLLSYSTIVRELIPVSKRTREIWREAAFSVAHMAPDRVDVPAAYLNWLISINDTTELEPLIQEINQINPAHPVSVWFKGYYFLLRNNQVMQRKGLSFMRAALSDDLERYMFVDENLKQILKVQ